MNHRVVFYPVTREVVERFAPGPLDELEIRLTTPGLSIADSVYASAAGSMESAAAVADNGDTVAVFGFALTRELACPWMLSSESIEKYRRDTALAARPLILRWKALAGKTLMGNYIHKDNQRARAFVTSLGFVILPSPAGSFDFFYLP